MYKKNIAFSLAILLLVVGCATTSLTRSGFLKNYSDFKPGMKNRDILVDFPEGREWAFEKIKTYDGFIIDPIAVNIPFERYEKVGIKPEAINEITEYFYDQLTKRLKDDGYYLVNRPAKGIMRIRIALTDIVPSKAYLNLHWLTKLSKAGTGGASVEAEFIDSITEERVVALIYARQGRGIMYHEGFSKWGYTKDSLQQLVTMLHRYLIELRGDEKKK